MPYAPNSEFMYNAIEKISLFKCRYVIHTAFQRFDVSLNSTLNFIRFVYIFHFSSFRNVQLRPWICFWCCIQFLLHRITSNAYSSGAQLILSLYINYIVYFTSTSTSSSAFHSVLKKNTNKWKIWNRSFYGFF